MLLSCFRGSSSPIGIFFMQAECEKHYQTRAEDRGCILVDICLPAKVSFHGMRTPTHFQQLPSTPLCCDLTKSQHTRWDLYYIKRSTPRWEAHNSKTPGVWFLLCCCNSLCNSYGAFLRTRASIKWSAPSQSCLIAFMLLCVRLARSWYDVSGWFSV